jgi:hypothetical protein
MNHVRASYRSADDTEFFLNVTSAEPHNIAQKELSDLIRGLQLSNNKTELLSSRLHHHHHHHHHHVHEGLGVCPVPWSSK